MFSRTIVSAWIVILSGLVDGCLREVLGAEKTLPSWATSPPNADGNYYYAVGIGEADSLVRAVNDAKKHAWLELVQQIVGVSGVGTEEVTSDLSVVKLKRQVNFGSDLIEFRGIETVEIYTEAIQSGTRSYVLYRLPIKEAKEIQKEFAKNRSGSAARLLNRVIFESDPSGAEIMIDGESYGWTPLTISLPPRAYVMLVKKIGFRSERRKLLLRSGVDQTFQIHLDENVGSLSLQIQPENADVFIDHKFIQAGSIKNKTLSAGDHRLVVHANGYEPFVRSISIRGNRSLKLEVRLAMKKSDVNQPILQKESVSLSFNKKCSKLVTASRWPALVKVASEWKNIEPMQPNPYYYIGLAYLELNLVNEAIEQLNESLKRNIDVVALQTLCRAYLSARDYKKAYNCCYNVLQQNLSDSYTYVLMAEIQEGKYDYRSSYEYYKVAISLNKQWKFKIYRFCERYSAWRNVRECQQIVRYAKFYN